MVKRYTIISKGLSAGFANNKQYRFRNLSFDDKKSAEKFFEKLDYSLQREQKIVRING